jgi:hypothetical protein
MNNAFFSQVAIVSTFSALLPIVVYFARIREQSRQNHMIGAMLVLALAIDVIMWQLHTNNKPTLLFNNLYIIFSFLMITAFYYEVIFKKRARYAFAMCLLLFVIGWVVSSSGATIHERHSYAWAFTGVIIGAYSIMYICIIPSMIIDRFLDRFLYSNAIISMSFTFYYSATLFLFCLSDFVFTELTPNEGRIFWSLHNACNVVKNLALAVGLFFSGKRQTYITLEQLEKMSKEELFR